MRSREEKRSCFHIFQIYILMCVVFIVYNQKKKIFVVFIVLLHLVPKFKYSVFLRPINFISYTNKLLLSRSNQKNDQRTKHEIKKSVQNRAVCESLPLSRFLLLIYCQFPLFSFSCSCDPLWMQNGLRERVKEMALKKLHNGFYRIFSNCNFCWLIIFFFRIHNIHLLHRSHTAITKFPIFS